MIGVNPSARGPSQTRPKPPAQRCTHTNESLGPPHLQQADGDAHSRELLVVALQPPPVPQALQCTQRTPHVPAEEYTPTDVRS
jgi:hypothetical protein